MIKFLNHLQLAENESLIVCKMIGVIKIHNRFCSESYKCLSVAGILTYSPLSAFPTDITESGLFA